MRIQCKQCGKEYRVKKESLTEEGIRAKCRRCGAILRIRLQKKELPFNSKGENPFVEEPKTVASSSPSSARYCMTCGHPLEREISPGERPLCSACEVLEGVEQESLAFGRGVERSHPSYLWYLIIFVVLFFSALLGYRLALS